MVADWLLAGCWTDVGWLLDGCGAVVEWPLQNMLNGFGWLLMVVEWLWKRLWYVCEMA
jgi:hypothetical protein